jgi:hypothetical protein
MFTSVDKAITAGVMAVVYLINHFTSFHFMLDEGTVTGIIGVITPVLVYFIPNKRA